jgi:hypothetical protein
MLDDLAIDFDEDWAEEDASAPKIRLMGKIYTLPATLPAKLVLFVHRVKTGEDDAKRNVGITEIKSMVGVLIGADAVEEIVERGIGIDRLGDVLQRCMAVYRKRNNKNADADDAGEANAPKGAAPEPTGSTSSSASGHSSSPTGAASTEATSAPSSATA